MLRVPFRHLAAGVSALALAVVAAPSMSLAGETVAADIVRPATDLPAPLIKRGPQRVRVDLEPVGKFVPRASRQDLTWTTRNYVRRCAA